MPKHPELIATGLTVAWAMAARDNIIRSVLDDSLHTSQCVWVIKNNGYNVRSSVALSFLRPLRGTICRRSADLFFSPRTILFCGSSEQSQWFHNFSTSVPCAARQSERSWERDRQGCEVLKDGEVYSILNVAVRTATRKFPRVGLRHFWGGNLPFWEMSVIDWVW